MLLTTIGRAFVNKAPVYRPLRITSAAGVLAAMLAFGGATPLAAQTAPAAAAADEPESAPVIQQEALQALRKMGAYLSGVKNFEVKADTSLDLIMQDGQRVQRDMVTTYKVRRPDGFVIETTSDRKARQFFYDGKQLSMNSPKLGYYATIAAPPTIHQTLDEVERDYGVKLPLEDLFRWSDPSFKPEATIQSALALGTATIDGVQTDQYAFREGDLDWQIWIQQGPTPLPRRLVIVDRSDEANPQYIARMTWNTAPTFAADTFTFRAPAGAKPIRMTKVTQ